MTGPIKPSEVVSAKETSVPDAVFEAFNELIVQNICNTRADVGQDEVLERIMIKLRCTRQDVFDKGWLDIEDIYRAVGWDVEYDKPGYNETYKAFFTFRVDNNRSATERQR